MTRQVDIDQWRCLNGPDRDERDDKDGLSDALITATEVDDGTLAAVFLDRARNGDIEAVFELACVLRSEGDHLARLAQGWLGYAALLGHRGAGALLARILLAEAAVLELGHADSPAEHRVCSSEILKLIWRAVELSNGTIDGKLVKDDYHRYLSGTITAGDILHRLRDDARAVDVLFVPAVAERPEPSVGARSGPIPCVVERKVIGEIGDREGSEGRRIARTYRRLTEPLPLKPLPLAADTVGTLLARDYPWMSDIIEAIIDDLRLQAFAGRPWLHVQPTILVGPPGCGKTAICRDLARLAATGFGVVDAGGSTDNRLLAGTARGWSSAQPAYPLQLMLQSGAANPMIVIDEIDKGSQGSKNGDVGSTLLGMIEPGTARAWLDECLMSPADLSAVSWLMTANNIGPVPRPLRSRCRTIYVPRPGPRDAETVLNGLERELRSELALPPGQDLPVSNDARSHLVAHLRRGGDIRKAKAGFRRVVARSRPGYTAHH